VDKKLFTFETLIQSLLSAKMSDSLYIHLHKRILMRFSFSSDISGLDIRPIKIFDRKRLHCTF